MAHSSLEYTRTIVVFIVYCFYFGKVAGDLLGTCQAKDFHFEYTECDSYGGRWRVSVPTPGKCIGGAPNPPVRGKDCTFTCLPGSYLDIQGDQDCHGCPAGTFSLGGGILFQSWDKLPAGFSVTTEGFSEGHRKSTTNCSKSAWTPVGNFMIAFGSKCSSTMVYSATLARAGSVTFKYQYSDDATIFHFFVQNDQCQAQSDPDSNVWPSMTEEGEWKEHKMDLKSGVNILQWKVIGIELSNSESTTRKPVLIKEIEISGVAFTSECTKCPAGQYSTSNSSECFQCQSNTFSVAGAGKCTKCPSKQYSARGASKCIKMSKCSNEHFYDYMAPCNDKKMSQKLYQWINPKHCDETLPGALTLPKPGPLTPCPPCNPGMYNVNASKCDFCPKNTFSNGASGCKPCPSTTAAVYGINYMWWNQMPPNTSYACMSLSDDGCATKHGWINAGDHIHSGKGHMDDAYVVLNLNIGGFAGSSSNGEKSGEVGELSFVIELDCSARCALFFVEDSAAHGASVIKAWYGKTGKINYKYQITKNEPLTFSWAFQKTSWDTLEDAEVGTGKKFTNDIAKIYAINVTNTRGGGASECMKCPEGLNSKGCIPCPAGHYIDRNTTKCVSCPPNTIINGDRSYGVESCHKCGPGLKASGTKCTSDCTYTSDRGRQYDFSALQGTRSVIGTKLFTSSGTQYYHVFNISLCGTKQAGCYNNFSTGVSYNEISSQNAAVLKMLKKSKAGDEKPEPPLRAYVCRSTIIPPKSPVEPVLSAQPVSLGEMPSSVAGYTNTTRPVLIKQLKDIGWVVDEDELDVQFKFLSEMPTEACPKGRSVTIIMRCEVKEKGNGTIDLPPKCPDGTCDGCNFNFMWRSRYACPQCEDEDYEEVKGECVHGEQIIHFYPPKHCVLSGTDIKPRKRMAKCELFPLWVKISVLFSCLVGIALVILLVYCWKRNRKLEYKYMKLVAGSGSGKDGDAELPAAETCAIDDEDDDEPFDSVTFSKESKGKKLFNKLKSMAGKGTDDNPFAHIRLTEKTPMTS